MSFFSKLFSRKSQVQSSSQLLRTTGKMTAEHRQLVEFYRELKALLSIDKYLAVSDYKALVPKYADLYNFFNAQKRAKTLSFYCSQNDLQEKWVDRFLEYYVDYDEFKTIPASVEKHNKDYIDKHLKSEQHYLDNILKTVDPQSVLMRNNARSCSRMRTILLSSPAQERARLLPLRQKSVILSRRKA